MSSKKVPVRFFFRRKNPAFFSIESIFYRLMDSINGTANAPVEILSVEMPRPLSVSGLIENILYTKKNQLAVNHITGDVHYAILGCNKRNRNILTIHDSVSIAQMSKFSLRYWMLRLLWFELPLAKASVVTVVSDKTREELRRNFHFGKQKIVVIPNSVDPSFVYQERAFQRKPTLLFVGTTPNKNLERTLEAIEGLDCSIHIVGKVNEHVSEMARAKKINFVVSTELSNAQIVAAYQNCDIVLFPTLYEGFGMIIVEANATGRPVITSNLSPMKEVAGDAALLVDPYQVSSIRDAVSSLINDAVLRQKLIKNGLENVKRFSEESVQAAYLNLYVQP
jgi:glycosyltransferase involved in cell wall biosynthesis